MNEVTFDALYTIIGVVLVATLINLIMAYIIKKIPQDRTLALSLLKSLKRPIVLINIFVGFFILLNLFLVKTQIASFVALQLGKIQSIILVAIIIWWVNNAIGTTKRYLIARNTYTFNISGLGTALQICISFIGALVILDKIGISISGILAVGGIGGIAAGLAARDIIANLFGFLIISVEHVCQEGDRIILPGKNLVGTIDKLSIYHTRMNNLEGKPMYVPNALFTTEVIINESRSIGRQINEVITISFTDPNTLGDIEKQIKMVLLADERIRENSPLVSINSVEGNICKLLVAAFTYTKDYGKYIEIKQSLLQSIKEIVLSFKAKIEQ